jgi:release factor glutamine methyltransferase
MASVYDRLLHARKALTGAGIAPDAAALDAEVLARHVLGWDRAALLSRWRDQAPGDLGDLLDPLIARRAAREPVAYITGHREFWGLDFEVTPDVLIPRPETELIVEEALAFAEEGGLPRRIVDVGTGSGCIAVAIASEFLSASVIATDLSPAALAIARRNAARFGVDDRITFLEADLLAGVESGPELIVSNPPYVPGPAAPSLQPEVRRYEPASALFGGQGDGLDIVRRLLAAASRVLASNGRLVVEFGFGQEEALGDAARAAGWQVARVREDLQGIPRVAVLRR